MLTTSVSNADPWDLDLDEITQRLSKKLAIPLEVAQDAENKYRCFLALKIKYPTKKIVGTVLIDEFWHMHILHTHRYGG